MKLLSVNIGQVQSIEGAYKSGITGIFKRPVNEPVVVTRLGIPEDAVVDKKSHGGPDQAIYIYTEPDYAWWAKVLGRDMPPGTFGDNLTLDELESASVSVGDRLHIGEVVLEVTAARIPCKTLAARMGDPGFIEKFRETGRPGLYCRVVQDGRLEAGQAATLEPYQGDRITMLEMFRDFYKKDRTEAEIQRYLAAPIAIRARRDKEKQLEKLRESTMPQKNVGQENTKKHE